MKDYPHDEFFRYLFSLMPVVRAFLTEFLPDDLLSCLDLDTLVPDETAYITPELAAMYSDKVFRCDLRATDGQKFRITIALLLEHKSFAPQYPHFQLNEYRQRIWSALVSNGETPVMVLPIVLYHGRYPWSKRPLSDYFGYLPPALQPYIGSFDYHLVDLTQLSDERLLSLRLGFLASGLLTMKHSQDKDYLVQQMKLIFEQGEAFLKTDEGRTFVETLFVYYTRIVDLDEQLIKEKIISTMTQDMQAAALSTYDRAIAKGRLEGEIKGKLEQSIFFAKRLLATFPDWPDQRIVQMTGLTLDEVKRIRLELARKAKPTTSKPKP